MKFLASIFILCICSASFGQEKIIHKIEWKEIVIDIERINNNFSMPSLDITPSLSFINSSSYYQNTHTLMVIDLSIDLRAQNVRSKTPALQIAKNKFIQSEYPFALPSKKQKKSAFTITSNGSYNNQTNKEIKNTAYKDLSLNSVYYFSNTDRITPLFISN